MNNNFSFSRLGKLVVTDLASNRKQYLMWIGLVAAFMLAWTILYLLSLSKYQIKNFDGVDPMWAGMKANILFTLVITTIISASLMMNNLTTKTSRINALMLPALPIEKFIARWIIFVPLYFLVFLVLAQCVDAVRCLLEVIKVPMAHIESLNVYKVIFDSNSAEDTALAIFFGISAQSIFVLGSAVWPKMSLVKTALFMMAYSFVWTLFFGLVLFPIMNGYSIYVFEDWFNDLTENQVVTFIYIATAVWALINFGVAYWRYRDTEIVQRW